MMMTCRIIFVCTAFFCLNHIQTTASPIPPLTKGDILLIDIGCIAQQNTWRQVAQGLRALNKYADWTNFVSATAIVSQLTAEKFFTFLHQIKAGGPTILYRGTHMPSLMAASLLGADPLVILKEIEAHLSSYPSAERAAHMAAAYVGLNPATQAATLAASDAALNLLTACIKNGIRFFVTGNIARTTYENLMASQDFAILAKAAGTLLSSDCQVAKPDADFYRAAFKHFGLAGGESLSARIVCLESDASHVEIVRRFIARTYEGTDSALKQLLPR